MKNDRTPSRKFPVHEIAVISVLCGILLGALAICLCNAITALCGVEVRNTVLSIGFRCGVAFVISLLGLVPLVAVARVRKDLMSFILGGPQLALWGCITFLAGGIVRWGSPPEFMWPIFAGFILYGVVLQSVVLIIVEKLKSNHSEDTDVLPRDGELRPSAAEEETRMEVNTENSLRRWKRIAVASAGILLVVAVVFLLGLAHKTDDRLIGTWQSDANRTIAAMSEQQRVDEKLEAFRKLFGKLRITYTEAEYTTEWDGITQSGRYEILGQDKLSVVIREIDPESSPFQLEMTQFMVIHFDGPDLYWVHTMGGGIREYFKRIK